MLSLRDFPVRYEGPHVITKKQMWVGVVSKGSDGTSLNSSYANRWANRIPGPISHAFFVNRFSASYQNSLGNTIGLFNYKNCILRFTPPPLQWILLVLSRMVSWCSSRPIPSWTAALTLGRWGILTTNSAGFHSPFSCILFIYWNTYIYIYIHTRKGLHKNFGSLWRHCFTDVDIHSCQIPADG